MSLGGMIITAASKLCLSFGRLSSKDLDLAPSLRTLQRKPKEMRLP
jgi:hypothetical protein